LSIATRFTKRQSRRSLLPMSTIQALGSSSEKIQVFKFFNAGQGPRSVPLVIKLCLISRDGCGSKADSVHLNDAFFSAHSTACSLGLIYQLMAYSPRRSAPSLQFWIVFVSAFSVAAGCLVLTLQVNTFQSMTRPPCLPSPLFRSALPIG
jgi:hypothetical protein